MMSKVKNAIKNEAKAQVIDPSTLLIEQELNSLFYVPRRESEVRRGLHASAIIAAPTQFCLREQVLSLFFERNKTEKLPVGLMRIFAEGNAIHEKWQEAFVRGGLAVGIEDRAYSSFFDLYMTPDAIIKIDGRLYVVEIKSCNTFSYKHMVNSHPSGTKQLQVYMHFLCIPRGFVLAEDKNTQEFKIFPVEYEPNQARPYVERLFDIKKAQDRFFAKGKLPIRMCNKLGCKRADACSMSEACFGTRRVYLPEFE